MIHENDLYTLIELHKCTCMRVCDKQGNKLFVVDANNCSIALNELKKQLPLFKNYGTLQVQAGDKKAMNNNFKSSYCWLVEYAVIQGTGAAPVQVIQPKDTAAEMLSMLTLMQKMQEISGANKRTEIPSGFISQSELNYKLEVEKIKNEMAMFKLKQNQSNNDIDKYAPLAPFVMSALGKNTNEIKEMMQLAGAAKILGAPSAVESAEKNVKNNNMTSFEELQKISIDEKQKMIEKLITDLTTKISAEQFIMLLQTLNNKPELADKAVKLVQSGMI